MNIESIRNYFGLTLLCFVIGLKQFVSLPHSIRKKHKAIYDSLAHVSPCLSPATWICFVLGDLPERLLWFSIWFKVHSITPLTLNSKYSLASEQFPHSDATRIRARSKQWKRGRSVTTSLRFFGSRSNFRSARMCNTPRSHGNAYYAGYYLTQVKSQLVLIQ